MISSGEVGAVLTVVDQASPILRALEAQLDAVQAAADRLKAAFKEFSLPGGLNRSLTSADARLQKMADTSLMLTAHFDKIDASMAAAATSMAAMSAEMRSAAAASATVGRAGLLGGPAGGAGGGGRGGHGGARPFGVSGPPVGAGGFHMHGSTAAMVGAGALAYGVFEESQIEDIVTKALITGQIKVDSGMMQTEAARQMRELIQRVSTSTGFGPKEVGEALLTTERQFGGLSFKDRLKIEDTLIPFAAAEARLKETTLPQAFEAMVGLAHMSGTYDPKQLPELMRQFQYTSMITPVPIEQFQRAISYSLPMLHAGLDMDPSAVMFLTAMTQTAGVTNTKSGTWLRSFFENAEPRMGISKTDITHNKALQQMGLLDGENHVTWQMKDAAGKTDWDASILKMSELINKFTKATDPADRLATLRHAFGERGGGEASLMNLDQFIGQFPVLQEKMRRFIGGDDVLKSLFEASPVQQARTAWADMQSVLMDIGQGVLPPLSAGLRGFDNALKGIRATLGPTAADAAVAGGAVAALGAWVKKDAIVDGLLNGGKWLGGALGGSGLALGGAAWELGNPNSYLRQWMGKRTAVGKAEAAAAPPLPYGTIVDKNYGDRKTLYGGNLEREREANRGRALSGLTAANVSATLQATVNTTVPFTVNIDGRAVAEAIMPRITQLINQAMHAVAGQLTGATNEIADYHHAGNRP